jgi:AcrR family transcriptional regulator
LAERDQSRRVVILRAAEKLLRHYGYAKTTVADIAAAAGVGVGTVYLEYPSKNDIVGALAQERHERMLIALREVVAGPESFSHRLRLLLETRVRAHFQVIHEGQHGADLVSCACPTVHDVQQQYQVEERQIVAQLLRAGHEADEFDVTSADDAARVILKLSDAFTAMVAKCSSLDSIQADLDLTHRLLLDGLRRR